MSISRQIHGRVTLTMQDGTTRTMSNRLVLQLLGDVGRLYRPADGLIPADLYLQLPKLAWFRDAISVSSTGDDHIFEIVIGLIRGPAPTPLSVPDTEGSAAFD